MMCVLRVSLFGNLRVDHGDKSAAIKVPNSVQTLLAYLLLHRDRYHSRAQLAGLLWGDTSEDRARSCLSTALWRLRQVCEPASVPHGTYIIATPTDDIGFNKTSDHWIDVAAFEEQTSAVLARPLASVTTAEIEQLERSLQLYAGDLLEGCYENWILHDRERLRNQYMDALNYLMHYHSEHGGYPQSLAYGKSLLRCDPLREEVHRTVMRLHVLSGQRPMAVRQYETCRDILRTELGITPMEQTEALYAQIIGAPSPCALSQATSPNYEALLEQLRTAMRAVEEAREQIRRTIELTEHLTLGTSNSLLS